MEFAGHVDDKLVGDDWVCTVFRAQGFSYAAVVAYLVRTIGAAGENLVRLSAIANCVMMLGLPFFICADWNMTPQQLAASDFLTLTDSTIMQV